MPSPSGTGPIVVCMCPETCSGTHPVASAATPARGLCTSSTSTGSSSSRASHARRARRWPTWVRVSSPLRRVPSATVVRVGSTSPRIRTPATTTGSPSSTSNPAARSWRMVISLSWLPSATTTGTPSGIARARASTQNCSTAVPAITVSPALSTTCAPERRTASPTTSAIPTLQCRSLITSAVTQSVGSPEGTTDSSVGTLPLAESDGAASAADASAGVASGEGVAVSSGVGVGVGPRGSGSSA